MFMETIVALATAPIKSALHIIRVSGDDSFEIVYERPVCAVRAVPAAGLRLRGGSLRHRGRRACGH